MGDKKLERCELLYLKTKLSRCMFANTCIRKHDYLIFSRTYMHAYQLSILIYMYMCDIAMVSVFCNLSFICLYVSRWMWCTLTPSYFILFYLILSYLILSYLILSYLILSCLTLYYIIKLNPIQSSLPSFYFIKMDVFRLAQQNTRIAKTRRTTFP